ncbi:MAG: response regulator transcription factor [Lachnospiraceae bacterium]|nr:response regulator transcription factor [Lachnospiraceae bacterium]
MYKILIVEDDEGIAESLSRQIASWDMEPHPVVDFHQVMQEFAAVSPHLVLLDIMLPFYNGYYWCSEIRRVSNVPIVFLSSASDNMNIVMAMNMGGDDFIAKPFDMAVLISKIQALLRRTYDFGGTLPVLEHRGALLNTGDNTLTYRGEQIPLSKNEYRILLSLLESKGQVVSRERLMEKLWETDSFVDDNTLTVNVNRLRKKLEAAGLEDFIATKFGVGYMVSG